MPLNLIKLCVGIDSVEELADWQRRRAAEPRKRGVKPVLRHRTRSMPQRREEVLDGGSLYWVIKGLVQVRQKIIGLVPVTDKEGGSMCEIRYAPRLVRVELRPQRPFQGWRYLEADAAPPDLPKGAKADNLPGALAAELRSLGLL